MTQTECAVYNYYYAKGGKDAAEDYLKYLKYSLDVRRAQTNAEAMEGKPFQQLTFGAYAGIDSFASGIANLFNTDNWIPPNAVQQQSQLVREDLYGDGGLDGKIARGAYDLISTTANMLPSVLTSTAIGLIEPAAGAAIGTVLMGSSATGLFWKLLERFGVQSVQFILQIVLARLLAPEHYGVLSLMIVFTTLANVFIQAGFNTALIQKKDVTEDDYSSVFCMMLMLTGGFYLLLFFTAPLIGKFYTMPELVNPLRVLALMLFPGAVNSIQLAKVSRELDFRKVFFSNIGAILGSGIAGIVLAYCGAGLWALVVYNLLHLGIACVIMWFTVKWRPRWVYDFNRIKELFSFGWKLMVSNLIDALYQDLRSLVIGKKYDSGTLGYYNRGKQFPQFIINAVNGAVHSVMLPAMSAKQDDKNQVKLLMRKSVTMSAYIIFPLMAERSRTRKSGGQLCVEPQGSCLKNQILNLRK